MPEISSKPESKSQDPDFLEHERFKGEHFTKTNEIQSEVLAILGDVPNRDELGTFTGDDYYRREFAVSGDGTSVELVPIDPELFRDAIIPESVLPALSPLLSLLAKDYAGRMAVSPDSMLLASVGMSTYIDSGDEINRPHLDGKQEDPVSGVFYLAFIGAPTKIWEGKFVIGEDARDAEEMWLKEAELLEKQIEEKHILPTDIPPNSIICIDSQTVHAGPGTDPEVVGAKRTLIQVSFVAA